MEPYASPLCFLSFSINSFKLLSSSRSILASDSLDSFAFSILFKSKVSLSIILSFISTWTSFIDCMLKSSLSLLFRLK